MRKNYKLKSVLFSLAVISVYHGHAHSNPFEFNTNQPEGPSSSPVITTDARPEDDVNHDVVVHHTDKSDHQELLFTHSNITSDGGGKNNGSPKSNTPVKSPGCKVMFKDNEMVTVAQGKIVKNDAEALKKAIQKGQQHRKVMLNQQPSIESEEHPGGMDPKLQDNSGNTNKSETNYMLPDSTNVIIKAIKPKGQ